MAGQIYSKFDLNVLGSEQTTSEGNVSGFTIRCNKQNLSTTRVPIMDGNFNSLDEPTLAQTIGIVSSSSSDTPTLLFRGLDSNMDEISEVITITGTNPINTVKEFYRVFRVSTISGNTNIGTISFSYDGQVRFQISPNAGTTRLPTYTVPRGFRAFLTKIMGSVGKGKDASIDYSYRMYDQVGFNTPTKLNIYQSTISDNFEPYVNFEAGTDFKIFGSTSSSDAVVTAGIDFIIISEEVL